MGETKIIQAYKALYDEIMKLPVEKIGKAISYIHFLEQEPETELYIDPFEEIELHELLASGDMVDAPGVLANIMMMSDD